MYHPKHAEQFPDKINCVTLHLVGRILEDTLFLARRFYYLTVDVPNSEIYPSSFPKEREVTRIYELKLHPSNNPKKLNPGFVSERGGNQDVDPRRLVTAL